MRDLDVRQLTERLRTIESVALASRVTSTNEIGRRVIAECIENEIDVPTAIIIAREQVAGRGRNSRLWHSPAGKGIYTTTMLTRASSDVALLPLEAAIVVAGFLRETYGLDPKLKWPNDVLVAGRKISGILIEGRTRNQNVLLLVGIGINVEPMDDPPPGSISIAEASKLDAVDIDSATEAFVEYVDRHLARRSAPDEIIAAWSRQTIHQRGDAVECVIGDRRIEGLWLGIDDRGQAMIEKDGVRQLITAGDLFLRSGNS